MSRDSGLEVKVGSFVLMAMLALTFFIISITDLSIFEKGRHIQVVFGFVSGLGDAAPVRLAGVEVGLVKKLEVFTRDSAGGKTTAVRVRVWLKDDVAVPVDSKITINQLGILGEKYLEIIPGKSADTIKDESVVMGQDPVPIEKITESASVLMTKLQTTVDSINNGILTQANEKSIADTLAAIAAVSADLKEGRGTLGKLITDDSIYDNLDDLASDLKGNPWKLLYRPKSR
jgi:phospholipid/cholesterol/gamma-HCH transport system substrate-binding protein